MDSQRGDLRNGDGVQRRIEQACRQGLVRPGCSRTGFHEPYGRLGSGR